MPIGTVDIPLALLGPTLTSLYVYPRAHQWYTRVESDRVISVGEKIDSTKPLLQLHSNTEDDSKELEERIKDCFIISEKEIKKLPQVYEYIN